jgi:hypothetical protein
VTEAQGVDILAALSHLLDWCPVFALIGCFLIFPAWFKAFRK